MNMTALLRFLFLAFLCLPLPVLANAGTVTHLSGVLVAQRADGTSKVLSIKSEVRVGDVLVTQQDTYARVKFPDGAEIVLRPNTQMKVEAYSYSEAQPQKDNFVSSLIKGGFRAVTGLLGRRNKDKVSFNTPSATIGIRGTHFGALLCQNDCGGVPTTGGTPPPNGLHVDVTTGAITVSNAAGSIQINAGQFGFAASANTPPMPVPPQQGIQVTMPSSISKDNSAGRGIGKGDEPECRM